MMTRYLLFVLLMHGCLQAHAADVRAAAVDPPGCDILGSEKVCAAVLISGKIEPGDTEKVNAFLSRVDQSATSALPIRIGIAYLDSPGGNVVEAMKIGRLLRSRQIGTFVTSDSLCASACVLVLAAGVHRAAAGSVEIHSFYSTAILGTGDFAGANRQYDLLTKSVEEYLREMRVPRALLDEMIKVPHSMSRRLTLEDTISLGLLGIDPVYAQVRKSK